jgi:diguanylate cyclase (GGDEF)-like protein
VVETILIVEDEDDIANLLAINLRAEGYVVHTASRGDDAVDLALDLRPDLVILDLMLPGADGVEVCRQLRKDPRTTTVGIIMLTARNLAADRVSGLEAGADDYVDKPFDIDELNARVRTSLRRARQLRSTSPLTGLPGNFEIERRIDERLLDDRPFALLHLDLDDFKAYNDHYGFLRGDRAIYLTSEVISGAAADFGDTETFVGHIGGDDFAVLCAPGIAEHLASEIVRRFDDHVALLYDPDDRARGCIEVLDRAGATHAHELLTISIGVASTTIRPFSTAAEAAAVAVELKRFAKGTPGSVWRIDRRRADA